MFGISGFELLIIVAFVLIIFGPDKLPELARTLGRATKMFKEAQNEMEQMIKGEILQERSKDLLKKQNKTLEKDSPAASSDGNAEDSAVAAWSVTAEDDEEEEDEE